MINSLVALGSNLGDREETLARALRALAAHPEVKGLRASRLVETEPMGPPQGRYLNAAVRFETTLSARALLGLLQHLEREAGRERSAIRNTARTLDLDLLFYGDACIDEPGLQVPHPRLHERGFVLVPLAEIAAEVVHPALGRTVGELAEAFREDPDVRPHVARGSWSVH